MKGCIPNRLLLLLLCCTSLFGATAQDKSNKGKEFWLGYGYCWNFTSEAPLNTQELVLYLSAEAPATVTVSIANTSWSQTVNIPANTVDASILIPKTGADDARIFVEGQTNRAIHIVSDTPIVVYAHTYNGMISAATMLMPVETYGFLYYSLNYSQAQSGSSPPLPPINTTQNGPDWYSWFYVIASEDNTRLQITPADTTRNGWLPNQTYTVNLNKGEIYTVMGKLGSGNLDWAASKDMTGSKVVAVQGADGNCHPFALFSGSSGIRLCKNDGGENMQQQVFPTQAWGTRYLTYHTLNNTATDINDPFKNFYRVAVADPTTIVKRNGVPLTGLTRNFYYEFLDSTGGDYIEADKPVLVAQYTPGGNRCYLASQFAYGDPEMFYLSPVEQGKKDVLFYATRKQNIDYNYLNVIVPTAGLGSLRLDGNPFDPVNIKTHPNNPAFSVAVARITGAAAQHRLVCDSTFTATVYGLGFFESYGYNVGT
ncbi:MAG TPA: IgGFc-binding protein, partial [Ferruginibacter sp.]|nr:IgGFc-binding protein [Ferruginibacter sp.]